MILECVPAHLNLPKNADKLVEASVCSLDNRKCAERDCAECGIKLIPGLICQDTQEVSFHQWDVEGGYHIKKKHEISLSEAVEILKVKLPDLAL